MPGVTLPPDQTRQVGGTIARVERTERRTIAPLGTDPVRMIFSYPGPLAEGIDSPPWYVPRSGVIELVRVSLLTAATTDHTVSIRVNGVEQQQCTLSAGDLTSQADAAISVGFGLYVSVATIAVSDSNMAVELRLR